MYRPPYLAGASTRSLTIAFPTHAPDSNIVRFMQKEKLYYFRNAMDCIESLFGDGAFSSSSHHLFFMNNLPLAATEQPHPEQAVHPAAIGQLPSGSSNSGSPSGSNGANSHLRMGPGGRVSYLSPIESAQRVQKSISALLTRSYNE